MVLCCDRRAELRVDCVTWISEDRRIFDAFRKDCNDIFAIRGLRSTVDRPEAARISFSMDNVWRRPSDTSSADAGYM